MSDTVVRPDLDEGLKKHRRELTGYCYRMLGSAFDAEDAVQETMVRAWKAYDRFEGRSSLRSWLYRIATNVCLDALSAGGKRARPMDLTDPQTQATAVLAERDEVTWLEPAPDGLVLSPTTDPAQAAEARESVKLAFMAALQHLPAKQRAVLILREVLAWKASEVAELLDTSVASVNSALQRARATLASSGIRETDETSPMDEEQQKLLTRYLQAFEEYDITALTALLHEDATLCMPPYDLWLKGHKDIAAWHLNQGAGCANSRLVPTVANGTIALGQYRRAVNVPDTGLGSGEGWVPWALQVLEVRDGKIIGLNAFLDTERWFPLFDLPERIDD